MGVRVHTLAKELNRTSKELMDILSSQGIYVKNHFASVDETMAAKLRIQFGGEDSIRKPKPTKGKKPAAVTAEDQPAAVEAPVAGIAQPAAPELETVAANVSSPEPAPEQTAEPIVAEARTSELVAPVAAPASDHVAVSATSPDEPEAPVEAIGGSEPVVVSEGESAEAAAPVEIEEKADPPPPARRIEMAPGFGGASDRPKSPVRPVARPMPSGGTLSGRPRKARPLIIRAKPAAPPVRRPGLAGSPSASARPGGPPPRSAPGAGSRGGTGTAPPRGRTPGPAPSRGAAPSSGGSGDRSSGSRVRFFPGDGGMLSSAPPGRGTRHGSGRRSGKTLRGSSGRGRGGRQRESLDFVVRRRQEEILAGERPSELKVQLPITPKELAPLLAIKVTHLLKALLEEQVLVNANTSLNAEMLLLLGVKFSVDVNVEEAQAIDSSLGDIEMKTDPVESLVPRAPVVTILGHVDHGKTSLLDKIRETRVTQSESGGITQHISAYRVDHENKHVVFIDTPGHKAFTEMRARGANITDVAVLVVAADDGPMPQTQEAMEHAQAANVPIVVAINKIDKPNANVELTKQKLAEIGLSPPEWGGKTEMIEVSAIQGLGIDELLEHLSLETEILDLKANPDKLAIGTVLEARATTGRGNVITVLIQEGTLRLGDAVICGPAYGKIRTLSSTTGVPLTEAGPSTPVELTGLTDIPEAGNRFYGLESLSKAREIAEDRQRRRRAAERMERTHVTLEKLFDHISQGKIKEIKLVLKTDVQGHLEVLKKELGDLATEEVGVRIIRSGVGEVTEDDVLLADASDAIVIGFDVMPNQRARSQAEEKSVEIRTYQVIYQVIEEMRLALEGLLEPEILEEVQGSAEVLQIFRSSKLGNIAGCMVRSGMVRREDPVRLVREGRMIYEGKLDSLRRVKDDVREVKDGFECGLRIQGYNDVKIGDFIESFRKVEKARTLDESNASS